MRSVEIRTYVADALRNARTLALRLKQQHLSPLSGLILAFLATMTAATALFALYAILGPVGSGGGGAPDWTPPTLAVVQLDPPKPPSADVEALARPIFSKNRRPTAKAAAAPGPTSSVAAAPNGVTVSAIIKSKKANQAFVVSPEIPEGAWRKVGDAIESWTVTSIAPHEIILQSGAQTAKIRLYPEAPAPAGGAPGGPPKAPGPF